MTENNGFIERIKSDFDIIQDLTDVTFSKCNIKVYQCGGSENIFGEKLSLIYTCQLAIYNVNFSLKILAFKYERSTEILKLDLEVYDKVIEKEIRTCRNVLRRHRNLSGMFSSLIDFSKYLEMRRLIIATVFTKELHINLDRHEDGGLIIKYARELPNRNIICIGVGWRIDWDLKNSCPVDVVEVYYNNFSTPNIDEIKENLTMLTHPSLNFHTKLKLWRQLLGHLNDGQSDCPDAVQAVITIRPSPARRRLSEADGVLVISDNDDEEEDDVEFLHSTASKRRKVDAQQVTSSSKVYTVPD